MVIRRIGSSILTLLMVSVVIFTIAGLLPGDAAQEALGQSATPEQVAALRHEMGLDRPAPLRYVTWLSSLAQGDAGQSMVAGMPVDQIIAERLPNTLMLAGMTAALAVPLALLMGIVAAIRRGTWIDRAINLASLSMVALPEFLVATVGVLIFFGRAYVAAFDRHGFGRCNVERYVAFLRLADPVLDRGGGGADGAHDPRSHRRSA
jgi:peptide/nickel transport system permease protein